MSTQPHGRNHPRVDPSVFVAPGAWIVGDVEIGPQASIWFNAVVRADNLGVRIGARTNVQDGAVLHDDSSSACIVHEDSTVGHLAVVHGCHVARGSLIGMGAIVLTEAHIGEESVVAAGSVVAGGREYPARSLLVGSPARVVRSLSDDEVAAMIRPGVETYLKRAAEYGSSEGTTRGA